MIGELFTARARVLGFALAFLGCQQTYYQYSTLSSNREVRQQVETAAEAAGWRLEPACGPWREATGRAPSVDHYDTAGDGKARSCVALRVFSRDGELPVVEVSGDTAKKPLELGGTPATYLQGYNGSGSTAWDLGIDIGAATGPGKPIHGRADLAVRYGRRLVPSTGAFPLRRRWSASGLVGGGLTGEVVRDDRVLSARPELRLSLRLEDTVAVVPGRTIRIDPHYGIDISVAHAIGLTRSRQATELGLDLDVWPIGGVVARIGYQWGTDPGLTSMVGVKLGPYITGKVLAGVAIAALGVLLYASRSE